MGQVIGAVVADTQVHAQRAAKAVKVVYEELEPIITIKVHPFTSTSNVYFLRRGVLRYSHQSLTISQRFSLKSDD